MCSKEGTEAANRAGRHVLCEEAEDNRVGLSGEEKARRLSAAP